MQRRERDWWLIERKTGEAGELAEGAVDKYMYIPPLSQGKKNRLTVWSLHVVEGD